jgi:putative nucleotidyltransferase with HDIG domain
MLTRILKLTNCREGDILAADITNSNGVTLVSKGTVMNDYLKSKLTAYGICTVKIYNKLLTTSNNLQNVYIEAISHTKKIFYELVSGKPLNYQNVSCVVEKIFKSTDEYAQIIQCLEQINSMDEYTYTHSVNVAFYSMLIAKWLELSDRKVKTAIKAGLLHDIGKIKIPNEILNKKASLTREEFEIIKEHTILGYEMLKDVNEIDTEIKKAVLLHHERIDGSGYPYHFYSDNLNLYSKLVAIADVFDAMTSDRVYKSRSTPFEAFEMFMSTGVGIFDIKILKVFLNKLSGYLVGSRVLLSNGKTGEIVYIPLQNITYPIIRVESEYMDLSQHEEMKIISMMGSI